MSMLFTDMNYRDYFHKFLVFEVDNLTDDLKDVLDINEDDCFILCSNYVDDVQTETVDVSDEIIETSQATEE